MAIPTAGKLTPAAAAAANALGTAGVTAVTGTGTKVLIGTDAEKLSVEALPAAAVITTDKAKLDTFAAAGWPDTVAKAVLILVPALTEANSERLANTNVFPIDSVDAGIHGGAATPTSSTWVPLTGTVVVNPAAVPWAIAFKAIFPSPAGAGANGAYLALVNSAHASYFGILSVYAIDHTYAVVQCGNGTGTSRVVTTFEIVEGSEHTYLLTYDNTNLKLTVDGNLIATIPKTSFVSVPTDAFHVAIYNTTQGQSKVRWYGWAY